jgi:hypothetical protein
MTNTTMTHAEQRRSAIICLVVHALLCARIPRRGTLRHREGGRLSQSRAGRSAARQQARYRALRSLQTHQTHAPPQRIPHRFFRPHTVIAQPSSRRGGHVRPAVAMAFGRLPEAEFAAVAPQSRAGLAPAFAPRPPAPACAHGGAEASFPTPSACTSCSIASSGRSPPRRAPSGVRRRPGARYARLSRCCRPTGCAWASARHRRRHRMSA